MERWQGKVAVITGASSGIGAQVAKDLLKAGLIVVALARREDRLQEIHKSLSSELKPKFHPIKCDVSSDDDVKKAFGWAIKNLGGVDVLVNNAGTINTGQLVGENHSENIKKVLEINVMGIVYCTREAFKSMKERNVNGHVILINSVLGHGIAVMGNDVPKFNIYPPSKYAVTAMTEIYRQEFRTLGTKVKITSISPGLVDTEIVSDEWKNLCKDSILKSEDISEAVLYVLGTPPHVQSISPGVVDTEILPDQIKTLFGDVILKPEDISQAVLYVLSTPPHVQVHELTIKPVGEVF